MTVTASSGSRSVAPQLYDTLPLGSVRLAEQQDRFPGRTELERMVTFFQDGQRRIGIARRIAANADGIVARAADRIFSGGSPLSYLDEPLSQVAAVPGLGSDALAADQEAFQRSVETYAVGTGGRGFLSRLLGSFGEQTELRVVTPAGFSPINVARYGNDNMRKSLRDLGWFLRYVGYAVVAGDPSILVVNARGLRQILEKGCSLPAANVALQEMRRAAAELFRDEPESRGLVIDAFNVLLTELAVATPTPRKRKGSDVAQGLQLPESYVQASESRQRFVMRPALSGVEKAGVIRAAYRQVFERDIVKGYSLRLDDAESDCLNGRISMREFVRRLARSPLYRDQFFLGVSNSRAVELAFRHVLGRGVSTLEEFRRYFAVISDKGLAALIDALVDSAEYARVFGEETVPYLRDLGEEPQESANWGANRKLFNFSAPFQGSPQFITSFAAQRQPLPDQHVYGGANDPVANQYGAIFPSSTRKPSTAAAGFGYDSRRLLLGNSLGLAGQIATADARRARPVRGGPRVVTLQRDGSDRPALLKRSGARTVGNNERVRKAVIAAVYRQLIGNLAYDGERLESEESRLLNGEISLRQFIRAVARSAAFRRRFWDGLYVVKSIEVMHRHLLGRPSFGRWEIDAYFDVAARSGFYGLVDALLDSQEYADAFGDDTVPYERFITPADRNARKVPGIRPGFSLPPAPGATQLTRRPEPSRTIVGFRDSGALPRRRSWSALEDAARRDKLGGAGTPPSPSLLRTAESNAVATSGGGGLLGRHTTPLWLSDRRDPEQLTAVIRAAYRQVLGNVQPMEAERLLTAESQLASGMLSVRAFVRAIACSDFYRRRYFEVNSPQRFVELNFKHLLGRPPRNQSELSEHLRRVVSEGLVAEVDSHLDSDEYQIRFGEDIVPYPLPRISDAAEPLDSFNRRLRSSRGLAGTDAVQANFPLQLSVTQPRPVAPPASAPAPAAPAAATPVDPVAAPLWKARVATSPSPDFARAVPRRYLPSYLLATSSRPNVEAGRRVSANKPLKLGSAAGEDELQQVIRAIYRQLIGRMPLESERLTQAESMLRGRRITVAGFVKCVSESNLFQSRIAAMAPQRSADASHMALLGRAPTSAERTAFLAKRAGKGQVAAVSALCEADAYGRSFAEDEVPTLKGLSSAAGQPQEVVNRTAALYGGEAGQTPRG